jgi:GNAT superfamily N-acetyltransferase
MNLEFRPPRAEEWRICRMLLPETFQDGAGRDYLLCLRDEAPRIAGAASFRRIADRVADLRVHVVPTFRRAGIGSQIIAHAGRGAIQVEGTAEIHGQPGIEAFCRRNCFQRVDGLTLVEADIADMREYLGRLRVRIESRGVVVQLSEAPPADVARLHAQYVAHESELNPWRGLVANSPAMNHSPVVMIDARVAGILLWELQGTLAVVRSRVAEPGPHGKWINVALLAEGLEGAWARGARRVQFTYADSNADTRKLAARFKAEPVSILAKFQRIAAS